MGQNVMVTRFSAGMVLVLLTLLAGCASPLTRRTEQVPPELTFDDLQFRVYRGPALTASGWAKHASFRRDTSDLSGSEIFVRFAATSSRPEARVAAAQGSGNLHERRVRAWGGVRGEQSGEVATTEEAHYSAQDGLVRGERPIEIRDERLTARGPGFTLDPRDQVLLIEGGAHAVAGQGGR